MECANGRYPGAFCSILALEFLQRCLDAGDGFFLAKNVGDSPDMRAACCAYEADTEGIHDDTDTILVFGNPRHDEVVQRFCAPVLLCFQEGEHLGEVLRAILFPALLKRFLVVLGGGYEEEIGLVPQLRYKINTVLDQTDDLSSSRFYYRYTTAKHP